MCGFAGIVTWDDRYRVDRATLDAMSRRVAHRGPDGEGVYLNHTDAVTPFRPQCGLVHRRLAIIDLDERSLQPFDDGRYGKWLIYGGEIYNYRDLRARIETSNPSYRWRTESDTEVVMAALETWGVDAFPHFNGMLALAMWDETEQKLLLARDRMGQKPLYFAAIDTAGRPWSGFVACDDAENPLEISRNAECPAAIAFASELAALREVPWFDRSAIDYFALAQYLRWGYIPAPLTMYRAAAKLQPASWMKFSFRGCDRDSYYDANVSSHELENVPLEEASSIARRLVLNAVKQQMVADVPVGCFLSGGIDSAIIAAAMKEATGDASAVRTFTIGFDDAKYDESPFAAEVAKHLGTTHEHFIVKPDAAKDLPRLAEVFGEPFGDSSALPTSYLSRETRRHVKVALSGDGGDELFGGYDRYRAMKVAARINQLPAMIRDVVAARVWQALPGTHPKGRITRLKRLLRSAKNPPPQRYAAYLRLFDEPMLQPLLGVTGGLVETIDTIALTHEDYLVGGEDSATARDEIEAALATDRVTYLPDDLLAKVDRASMLHALEVRSPFMDHEVVSFAAGLPTRLLFGRSADPAGRGGKRLLRDAFHKDLPASVMHRRKSGFAMPVGDWLRGPLRPMLEDLLFAKDSFLSQNMIPAEARKLIDAHVSVKREHGHRLYSLLMLELWWRSNAK